jgi:hypothetical protein
MQLRTWKNEVSRLLKTKEQKDAVNSLKLSDFTNKANAVELEKKLHKVFANDSKLM